MADFPRDRAAQFVGGGVSPQVRKVPALLRLHRLDGAVVAHEEDACAAGFFLQGQSAPIVCESREPLDEVVLAQLLERGQARDFVIGQPDLTRPAAAGRATLAIVENGHGYSWWCSPRSLATNPARAKLEYFSPHSCARTCECSVMDLIVTPGRASDKHESSCGLGSFQDSLVSGTVGDICEVGKSGAFLGSFQRLPGRRPPLRRQCKMRPSLWGCHPSFSTLTRPDESVTSRSQSAQGNSPHQAAACRGRKPW
jgi:hypothetical protein